MRFYGWSREMELKASEMRNNGATWREIGALFERAPETIAQKFKKTGMRFMTNEECEFYGVKKHKGETFTRGTHATKNDPQWKEMRRRYPG